MTEPYSIKIIVMINALLLHRKTWIAYLDILLHLELYQMGEKTAMSLPHCKKWTTKQWHHISFITFHHRDITFPCYCEIILTPLLLMSGLYLHRQTRQALCMSVDRSFAYQKLFTCSPGNKVGLNKLEIWCFQRMYFDFCIVGGTRNKRKAFLTMLL